VGVGDLFGMHVAHAIVSGIGGIRTAGDLAARLQLNRSMKLDAAKKNVADKLGLQ
jgi:dimethylamine--corrinoid protein Co-methyltransferase